MLKGNQERLVANVSEKEWKERRRKENLDKVQEAIREGRERAKAKKERKELLEREKAAHEQALMKEVDQYVAGDVANVGEGLQ